MAGGYYTRVAGTTITAANENEYTRDQTVNKFASVAARTSAISALVSGMVSAQTDAKCLDYYDSTDGWSPIGPMVTDAYQVTTGGAFISSTAFAAEAETSTKMRLTLPQVRTGELWLIGISFVFTMSALSTDFTFRMREDNSTGAAVGTGNIPAIAAAATFGTFTTVFPWIPTADATSKIIVCTAVRNAGAGGLSVYSTAGPGTPTNSCFSWAGRVGDSVKLRSVP